jgi:hypothetical protein
VLDALTPEHVTMTLAQALMTVVALSLTHAAYVEELVLLDALILEHVTMTLLLTVTMVHVSQLLVWVVLMQTRVITTQAQALMTEAVLLLQRGMLMVIMMASVMR